MIKNIKWLAVLLLWVYIILRAIYVPMTHDEAYSYLLIKTNYIKAMAGTANTHWLNSLGMKIGSLLLGDAPWKLRIFSILAWLIYGWSVVNISERVKNKIAGIGLFVALVANPFLLDFFSLARGYGLACAFVSASLWKAIETINKNKWQQKQWLASLIFATLAVFSNYTSFYFFMSLIAAYVLFILLNKQWKIIWPPKRNWWWLLVVGTSILAIANLLFIRFYTGDLDYGSDTGFVRSIFGSLVESSLYFQNGNLVNLITYIMTIFLFVSIAYAVFIVVKHKKPFTFSFVSFVLLFMLLTILAFHIFFKTPFLYGRTTLVFYPVIVISMFYFFDNVELKSLVRNSFETVLGAFATIVFLFHFFSVYNYQYCYEWPDQADTKKCLNEVVQDNGKNVLIQRWHYGVYINYYSVADKNKYHFNAKQFSDTALVNISDAFADTMKHYDHAILLPPFDLKKMREKGLQFTVLKQFPTTGAAVLRMNQ